MRGLLPLVVFGLVTGCHVYRPLEAVEPEVGTRISADLTDYGADTLARYVGPGVASLRGDVLAHEDGDVVLAVTSVTDRFGREQFWRGERVRVPRPAVRIVRERRFSVGRTLMLGVACVGGSIAALRAFNEGTSGGSRPSGSGGGSQQ
jgi:hypothetical protein